MVVMRDKRGFYNGKDGFIFKWRGLKFFLFLIFHPLTGLDWIGLCVVWVALSPFVTVSLSLFLCCDFVLCARYFFFHLTFFILPFSNQPLLPLSSSLPFSSPFTWTHPLPLAIMSTIQHYSHNLTIQWQDHPTPTNPHFTFTPPVVAHHAWTWLLDLHLRLHSLPTQYFLLLKTLKRVSI